MYLHVSTEVVEEQRREELEYHFEGNFFSRSWVKEEAIAM